MIRQPETPTQVNIAHSVLAPPGHPDSMPFYDEAFVFSQSEASLQTHAGRAPQYTLHMLRVFRQQSFGQWLQMMQVALIYYFPDPTTFFVPSLVPAAQFESSFTVASSIAQMRVIWPPVFGMIRRLA